MIKRFPWFVFVLLSNLWIWRIFSLNLLVGFVVTSVSIVLWRLLEGKIKKQYFYFAIIGFVFLLSATYKTSSKTPITYLNDSEKLSQYQRLQSYKPISLRLGNQIFWLPLANWLENRKEMITYYKLNSNLSEVIDPNLYFFANHPRERVGVKEYEKFPYILLPLFLIGLASISKQNYKIFILSLSPIPLYAMIGNSNPMGPFALFPFFINTIFIGFKQILSQRKYLIPGVILYSLVLVQIISYAKN